MRQLRDAVKKSEDSDEEGQFDHVLFAPGWRRLLPHEFRGKNSSRSGASAFVTPQIEDTNPVLYVERLIAPGVIDTMPEKTLLAFADHGRVEPTLDVGLEEASSVLSAAATEGVEVARSVELTSS